MKIIFKSLPETAEAFTSMPEFNFSTPFQTAALFIVAVCAYSKNKEACYNMIDAIKGPQKLSPLDKQFLRDRMMGKAEYLGKSFFAGATPQNNYMPAQPYTIEVSETPYTYSEDGYAQVYVQSGGADNPRPIKLRKKGDEWLLWVHSGPLGDIRVPTANDPWA